MRLYGLLVFFSLFILGAVNCSAQGFDVLAEIDKNEELTAVGNVCPSELVQSEDIQFVNKTKFCSTNHETCFMRCTQGSSNHCFGLANHFNRNDVDDKHTRRLYAKSCQLGDAGGCTNVAASLKNFDGLDAAQCYTETFRKTCKAEDAWGCTMYAVSLVDGEGVEKSNKLALQALQNLEKLCDVDDPFRACTEGRALATEIRNGEFD